MSTDRPLSLEDGRKHPKNGEDVFDVRKKDKKNMMLCGGNSQCKMKMKKVSLKVSNL